jgi:oxaloacetate decarboxylase alpha subunit
MARIELIDTTIRDGNQSLWGATAITNAMAIQIAPVINQVGFHALDFITSTSIGVAVRFHKENPWERIRRFHAAAPNTRLGFLTSPLRFISWQTVSGSVMRLAFQLLVRNGITRFQVIDPMNNMGALLGVARIAREEGVEEIVAGLTFTVSPVHDDAFYAKCAGELVGSPYVDRVYLKDPGGLLAPERTEPLVTAVRSQIGGLPLELHSHCSLGFAPFSYLEAVQAGVTALHVAVGPVANGTSHPSAERIVANLRAMGHTIDIDDEALAKVSTYFRDLAIAEGLPIGQPTEFDATALQHQVPGGMLTTMRRQLSEIRQSDKFPAVLEEVARVRRDLGYPIMVTPFSQVVAGQAVMNVLSAERYANVPDEVIRYALGKFGAPPLPIDSDVRDRILNRPRARELAVEPNMAEVSELRRSLGANVPDEVLLLRAVMPAEQVDGMLAAGPGPTTYDPLSRSLVRAVKEFSQRKDFSFISVTKPKFSIQLKRTLRGRDAGSKR